jgi:hypothetical protein
MTNVVRVAMSLVAALVVAACTSGSGSAPSSSPSAAASTEATPSPVVSAVATAKPATPAPSVAPSAPAGPTGFTSTTYKYSLTVPGGWTVIQATAAWDGGNEESSHDVPQADQFVETPARSAWALVAPTAKDLKGYVKERIAANAAGHSNTCPLVPNVQDPIKIGSESATLLAYDCGILINLAVTVHDGNGYMFGFRDVAVHAATDPTDRATFVALLKSVQFPG